MSDEEKDNEIVKDGIETADEKLSDGLDRANEISNVVDSLFGITSSDYITPLSLCVRAYKWIFDGSNIVSQYRGIVDRILKEKIYTENDKVHNKKIGDWIYSHLNGFNSTIDNTLNTIEKNALPYYRCSKRSGE